MGRRKDNSYLMEIFYYILPQYFFHEYEYLELMNDILESHHFQFEKERTDKQHLIYKMIDRCLSSSENDCQVSIMSILCSLWKNNQAVFRLGMQEFNQHFDVMQWDKI